MDSAIYTIPKIVKTGSTPVWVTKITNILTSLLIMDITGIFTESFWYAAPTLMTATVAITGGINSRFPNLADIWKQVISWAVGAVLCVLAWFTNFVTVGEPQWAGVLTLAVVVGLSSNGLYDIPVLKNFIDSWKKTTA